MTQSTPSAHRAALLFLTSLLALFSCEGPETSESRPPAPPEDALARVGSITITEQDLEWRIEELYRGRQDDATRLAALSELVLRAQFTQAALDSSLADDAIVRAEVSRLLEARLRERTLTPRLKETLEISQERLHEIYQAESARFQAPEKRQIAVLWLTPGSDPAKLTRYSKKLQKARAFALENKDLLDHPEKGFSALSVDHSEHHASRYRGGMISWLEAAGGLDSWTKAVAEIAFALKKKGEISEVTTRPEGIFLIRLVGTQPAVTRPFASVAAELERGERTRRRKELEAQFTREVQERHPVEMLK
jgi:hypothetical protein